MYYLCTGLQENKCLTLQNDRNGIILRISYVCIRLKTAMNYELLLLNVSSILGAEKIQWFNYMVNYMFKTMV